MFKLEDDVSTTCVQDVSCTLWSICLMQAKRRSHNKFCCKLEDRGHKYSPQNHIGENDIN